MNNPKYIYDVVFAFSKKDEHLADQINNLLYDSLNTFLFSKKLEEIARPNRELKIMEKVGKESKIVVVLFNKKWGNSPWTKIEEQAIRKRAGKEGYNFLLFIPLDHPPTAPKYVPKDQIWEGLGDSGIKGAAAVIKERVRLFEHKTSEKLPSTVASDEHKNLDVDSEKLIILDAVNSLDISMLELTDLFHELKIFKTKIEKDKEGISINYRLIHKTCTLHCGKYSIKFHMQSANNKTHKESKLYYELLKQDNKAHEPSILAVEAYHFEVKKPGEYGWMRDVGSTSYISSKELAEKSIKLLLKNAHSEK